MPEFSSFEEYKMLLQDAARFTDRRQTTSNMYVAVNSLLLTAIGVLVKDLATSGGWRLLLPVPLVAAGIGVCLWWTQLIRKYKLLVGLRIDTLREMESLPDMVSSVQIFHREDALYPRDELGNMVSGKGLGFSDLEARLPLVFLWLYGLLGVGLVGASGLALLRWIVRAVS
ncbi:MAG TPA: hypothetical protein VM537_36810 [Anaerolineae bacterium]|nr:hypothetical protein [Anaerolineae bacterium]